MDLKNKLILLIFFLLNNILLAQENSLKNRALEEFKNEHYAQAIALLEQAEKNKLQDAEIYYYLAWFKHYKAYDSRPLKGYDFAYSEQIFTYLDKAIALNPDYGDAKYFYGAECSGNAFLAMQNYEPEKLDYFYNLANEKGAYPNWLKEFGRNILSTCEKNAILFAAGNADFDVCTYLQLHENFRKDVTLIPIGNIDRPWYVQFLKRGLQEKVKKIDLSLTDSQIMDLHPFKWETTEITIPVSQSYKKRFNLSADVFQWEVSPDLLSYRMHAKIEGEKAKQRAYLSPQRAVLLQIIEDNFSKRPIFFSNFCSPTFYAGLRQYFQNCGLISLLTPVSTENTDYQFDYAKIENLLQAKNLSMFKTILREDIPRISMVVISAYYIAFLNLLDNKKHEERNELKYLFQEFLQIGYDKEYENEIAKEIDKK
ncbi:MAG: hypothetical protein CSA05_02980 [Bacteroidia bacterium]|nr:MAG: hypothetical protein CSA05_02980 [Bacteroidia bacterium]